MEQDVPLLALAKLVAAVRARGLVARLAVRNAERFGLLHLYFEQGRLVHVVGHLGDPLRSLVDLGDWRAGSVRQDSVAFAGETLVLDPRLDAALDSALRTLIARRAVEAADVPIGVSVPPLPSWPSRGSRPPSPAPSPHRIGTGGLPPLAHAAAAQPVERAERLERLERLEPVGSATGLAQREHLTVPQWQLVALVVRQMVEKMGQLVDEAMAESLLRLALAHAARSNPVLHDLEVETSGWLKETHEAAMTTQATAEVAEAIAALLTNYELRCASLIGKQQAHRILASTAEPFRAALAQIGLDISG